MDNENGNILCLSVSLLSAVQWTWLGCVARINRLVHKLCLLSVKFCGLGNNFNIGWLCRVRVVIKPVCVRECRQIRRVLQWIQMQLCSILRTSHRLQYQPRSSRPLVVSRSAMAHHRLGFYHQTHSREYQQHVLITMVRALLCVMYSAINCMFMVVMQWQWLCTLCEFIEEL